MAIDPNQILPVLPLQGGRAVPGSIPNVPQPVLALPAAPPAAAPVSNFVSRQASFVPPPTVAAPPTVGFVSRQASQYPQPQVAAPVAPVLASAAPTQGIATPVALATGGASGNPFGFTAPAPQTSFSDFTPAPLPVTTSASVGAQAATLPQLQPTAAGGTSDAVPVYRGGAGAGGLGTATAAINAGFDRQDQTTQDLIRGAENYIAGGKDIFEQATRGRAIGGILHAVAGPNNAGSVFGQAADAANQGLVAEQDVAAQTAAQRYQTDIGASNEAARNATLLQQTAYNDAYTPKAIGQRTVLVNGIPQTVTTFGNVRPANSALPAATVSPINAGAVDKPSLAVGAPTQQPDGTYSVPNSNQKVTIRNGLVTAIQ